MTLSDALEALKQRSDLHPVPRPSHAQMAEACRLIGEPIPDEYVRYLVEASEADVGPEVPAVVTRPRAHNYLPTVVAEARGAGVPANLFPFCESNGDYYCLAPEGCVVSWSHNGWEPSVWPSLAAWISDVLLADYG